MKNVVIIGASGHAKVVKQTAEACGFDIVGFYDDNPKLLGNTYLEKPILGRISDLQQLGSDHYAIIAIGDNKIRKSIAEKLVHLKWLSCIHPHSYVDKTVIIGQGTVIFAGSVIQPDTIIGQHCIINTSASVDHDCKLGDYSHCAPGSHLAGGVSIGVGSFIGIGSAIIPNINIGNWTIIGAGSAVIGDIPDDVTAYGCPAKVKE